MNRDPEPGIVPALGYAWLTPLYDPVVRFLVRERVFRSALIEQAAVSGGSEILDLACGTGTLAVAIKKRTAGVRITGVDADAAILKIAAQKARNAGFAIPFARAVSTSLPYRDACFDTVVSSLFFHHLTPEQKRRTANEILRVLRPGGRLHVADWGRAPNRLMRTLFLPVQILDGFTNTRENVAVGLVPVFEQAGLEAVREERSIATVLGSLSLYSASKPEGLPGRSDSRPRLPGRLSPPGRAVIADRQANSRLCG